MIIHSLCLVSPGSEVSMSGYRKSTASEYRSLDCKRTWVYIPNIVIYEDRNMSRLRKLTVAALASVAWASVAACAFAQPCAPPPGFVDTPHPVVAPAEQLVARVEEITIDRPLSIVLT